MRRVPTSTSLALQETVTFAFKGGTYKLADLLPHRFGPMDLIDDPNTPLLLQPQSSNVELTTGATLTRWQTPWALVMSERVLLGLMSPDDSSSFGSWWTEP